MNEKDYQFDPSTQWGDYLIASDNRYLDKIMENLKQEVKKFIPLAKYHKQIKYWSYEGYLVEAGDLKGTIINRADIEQWKNKGLGRYLLPVHVYCWKYTPEDFKRIVTSETDGATKEKQINYL